MKKIFTFVFLIISSVQTWAQGLFGCIDTLLIYGRYEEAAEILNSRTFVKKCRNMPERAMRFERLGEAAAGQCDYTGAIDLYGHADDLYSADEEFSWEKARCRSRIFTIVLRQQEATIDETGKFMHAAIDACSAEIERQHMLFENCTAEEKRSRYLEYRYAAGRALIEMNLNLGMFANHTIGDYVSALEYCMENESTFSDMDSSDPRVAAAARANSLLFGDACMEGDMFEDALEYYVKILETDVREGRGETVDAASVYRKIGDIHAALNDVETALDFYEKGESIFVQSGHTDHDEYALLLFNRGRLFRQNEDYARAAEDFRQAEVIQSRIFGQSHISVFRTQTELAECSLYMEDDADRIVGPNDFAEEAFAIAARFPQDFRRWMELCAKEFFGIRYYDGAIDMLINAIDIDTSMGKTTAFRSREAYYMLGESYMMQSEPEKAIASYTAMLDLERRFVRDVFSFLSETRRASYWKSCNAHVNGLFSLNRHKTDVAGISKLLYDAALFNKGLLLQTTAGIEKTVEESGDAELQKDYRLLQSLRRRQMKDPGTDADYTERLDEEAEKTERKVMDGVGKYGDFMRFSDIGWKDVRDALGEKDVAIEFVSSGSVRHGTVYYSAEVLRHDSPEPEHVFLFALSPNEQGRWASSQVYGNSVLGRKLWGRILPLLYPGDRIYFAASGDLHNTAIEYLKINDSTRMNDLYTMCRLSSTRQIAGQEKNAGKRNAVLYGGLNYNTDPVDMELYAAEYDSVRGLSEFKVPDTSVPWDYLIGTKNEVENIGRLLESEDYDVSIYTDDIGIEESFKALSGQKKQIIHLATHGFYLPDAGVAGNAPSEDYALSRAGLVLSGANNSWAGGSVYGAEDGILTAKEISLMDLRGADIVVLSACQTGLGEVSGEGVFGLQRGFKKAGVQTLLMTLWEVDDRATQVLMTEFYKALLSGKEKYEALDYAQKQIAGETFIVSGVRRSGSDPYFWASFILLD